MTTTNTHPHHINVTLSAYEGDSFPNADDLFGAYVLSTLTATYPGAVIKVSAAQGRTTVFVDGSPDSDLASEIANDWWTEFCRGALMIIEPSGHSAKPTLADLDALPPGIVGEIIEGVLYTMTKPRSRHQRATTGVGGDLRGPFDLGRGGPGGWWIIAEPGIELPNDTKEISPDVAGWRRERMPELPIDEPIRVVPDWVCEILSPTTRRHDLLIKLPYYAKIGVSYLWLVDLEIQAVTSHRLNGSKWVIVGVYGAESEAQIEPFEAAPLDVASWWTPR